MGFLEEIAEIARRALTGDDKYFKQYPYVLELRTSPNPLTWVLAGQAFIVFPMGPQNYSVKRVFRQSVTPTMGGIVAEEKGLLWRELTISGTFGLQPKFSFDTSLDPLGFALAPLSGPEWTRRLMRNFLEKYAKLKADPEFAAATKLIWHDMKTDDHWVVVPESASVDRNVSQRLQYPWSLQFKAIADADSIILPPSPSSLLSAVKGAVGAVNKATQLVASAIQEGTRLLGEVRYFVATIDSLIDSMTNIVASATDFVNGVTATISVGAAFIRSTAQLLEAALVLMETADGLPNAVRQTYQRALDGLHAIAAQPGVFGVTYGDTTAPIAAQEAGAASDTRATLEAAQAAGPPAGSNDLARARTLSSDIDLVGSGAVGQGGRTFRAYKGQAEYTLKSGDTLTSVAALLLGDGTFWYDLALMNGLKAPYISPTGGDGVVRPGDVIVVPSLTATGGAAVAGQGTGTEPGGDVLGTDFALTETPSSRPGAPSVDLAIDHGSHRDLQLVSGVPNLSQAIQLRLWTEQGRMPLAPMYGLRRTIGLGQVEATTSLLRVSYREALRQDPRIRDISALRFEVVGDLIEIDADVIPIGDLNAQTISTSLV